MMNRFPYRARMAILVLLAVFLSFPGWSTDPDRGIELQEDKWERTVEEVDYEESFWEPDDDDEEEQNQQQDSDESSSDKNSGDGFSLGPLKYVFIISVILGLLYLIILMANNWRKGSIAHQKITGDELEELESLSDPEADIEQFNLDRMLESALKLENYKLALRIQYLKIVQMLSESGAIDWKKEKTNYDYVRELKEHPGQKTFQKLTRDFEWTWYGDHELSKSDYNRRAPRYEAFQKTLTPDE